MKKSFPQFSRVAFLIVFVLSIVPFQSARAAASLSVTPITWNVMGLDSNNINVGPNHFPIGARVCNTGDVVATNIKSAFNWVITDPYINLRTGTLSAYTSNGIDLNPTQCTDFYYEAEITRNSLAYNHTARYTITASADGGISGSTPTPRELFVEYLVSQNRNAVTDVQYGTSLGSLASVSSGGTMTLVVGGTYYIKLIGYTATQGYEQLESFINFPNTIFQTLSVSTTYTADTSSYVSSPNDKAYADACKWENDPNSPNYRACLDVGKNGGNITVVYQVKILQVPSAPLVNPEPLSTLIYDFSGSSYHYNSDYGISTRYAYVFDPASITISKNFNPDPTNAGGVSALTFTLTNPTPVTVSGLNFTDTFPTSPGAMVVASPTGATTTSCGTPTFVPVAGAASISFSNGTLAPNSSCTIKVNVTVPVTGTYNNTSTHLFIGTQDTGNFATDTLTVNSAPAAPSPVCGLSIAQWTFPAGFTVASPAPSSGSGTASPGAGVNPLSFIFGTDSWGSDGGIATDATLVTTNNDYFQFAINTTGYSSVSLTFDARRGTAANSPVGIAVYYGSAAGNPETGTSLYNNSNVLTTTLTNVGGTLSFTPPAATTYVRIYFFNSGNTNSSSDGILDNVTFTGCAVPTPPTLTKAFSPNPVAVNGTSTLTFTLANPNTAIALSGINFSDSLPSGLEVASTPAAATTCTGSPTWSPTAGATTLTFGTPTGASIPASSSCTVSVSVKATTSGPHANVSGFISSTEGGINTTTSGYGTASLTAILPPSIAKAFAANPILAGGASTLTFTITNPNQNDSLTGLAFADTFPTSPGAMTVVSPLTTSNSCGGSLQDNSGGVLAAADPGIRLTGGTLAGGSACTVTVDVTAPTAGSYPNTSGTVSSTNGGIGNTASNTLTVNSPNPAIALLKQVSTSASGPWSSFLSVTPSTNVYYQFTVENTGDVPLSPISLTDGTLDVSSCNTAWSALTLQVADALDNDHLATCVVGPVAAVSGSHTNTAAATGTYSGTPYTSTSSAAAYATPELSIDKSATQSYFVAANDILNYSYVVENTGFVPLVGPVTLTDDKATVACPAVSTVGDNDAYLDPGETITCTATYTILAADVTTGSVTNVAHATVGGIDSPTDTVTVPRQLPDLTATKTNNTSDVGVTGTPFTWTVTMANAGVLDALFADGQTLLSDPLPAGATYASPTVGSFTGITNSANISCAIDGSNILTCTASGASVTLAASTGSFQVSFSVTPASSGSLANTATVDPNNNITESTETNNTGSNTVTVLSAPSISKNFSPVPIAVGGISTLTFTITNSNTGTSLTGVAFTDSLPAGLEVAGTPNVSTTGCGSPTFAPAAGNTSLTFSSASIAVSGTCSVAVDVTATTSGIKNNTSGNVSSTNAGTGNTASDSLTVNLMIDVSLTKNVNDNTPDVGDTVTFTLNVANGGPGTATNIDVTDILPSGYTYVAASIGSNAGATGAAITEDDSGSPTLTWSVDALDASESVTLTYDAVVLASGTYNNYAEITDHDQTDSDSTPGDGSTTDDDDDLLTVTPNAVADLSLTKTVDNSSPIVGDNIIFTITITNQSITNAATNVAVTDTLPAGLSFFSANPSVGTSFISPIWTIPSLAANSSAALQITATVAQVGAITNFVQVSASDQPDPDSAPNNSTQSPVEDDEASVTIGGLFDPPTAIKTFNEAGLPQLEFRMVWINSGNAFAINTQVTDGVPTGTTYVSGSITCAPQGSSSNALVVSSPLSSTAVPSQFCGFDAGNNRIQWQGTIGPDNGNLTEVAAANEVVITFRVSVDDAVNQIQNQGFSRTDVDADGNFDEETILGASLVRSNQVLWNRSAAVPNDPNIVLPKTLPATGFTPNVVTALPDQPLDRIYRVADVSLEIPSLNVNIPIVGVPLVGSAWDLTWLDNQAGWLNGTAFPGWDGNSVLTGHVYLSNGKPGPFVSLGNLKWGSKIIVHALGSTYTYEVRENLTVESNDTTILKHEDKAWLTLITCKTFNEGTNTYVRRIAVRAVLVNAQKDKPVKDSRNDR